MKTYFRISLGWDKNKWRKWSLLFISRGAPHKVWYQSLKFDCKCYITPFSSCLIAIYVSCYFPHLFLSRPSEILKYWCSWINWDALCLYISAEYIQNRWGKNQQQNSAHFWYWYLFTHQFKEHVMFINTGGLVDWTSILRQYFMPA